MPILVIDEMIERKVLVENALSRAGLLLTDFFNPPSTSLVAKISQSSIVIMLSDSQEIDWQDSEVAQSLFENTIVITHKFLINHQIRAKELVYIQSAGESSQDHFTSSLIKLVMSGVYRDFFPITVDDRMNQLLAVARKAAKSAASVLIEGETGTGKEVIAKYIHHHSEYSKGPFVAVNCAAIPETMIEAVLFGYEKGAFTNAINSHVGKFEQADHGTLFLDEIAEMSIELQAKLLRVLQENEVERIGGRHLYKVDIRVIAATNQNLMTKMKNGSFRADLYYRLNVVNLKCLPLRERVGDIAILSTYFMKLYAQQLNKSNCRFESNVFSYLNKYVWPGNIRELQNIIHRAVIMDEDGIIDINDIGLLFESEHYQDQEAEGNSLRAKEAEAIVSVLKETNGCRSDAAKKLMISPRTLRYKISKLKESGLDVPRRTI